MWFWCPKSLANAPLCFFIFVLWCGKHSVLSTSNSVCNNEAATCDVVGDKLLEETIPRLVSWIFSLGGRLDHRQEVRSFNTSNVSSRLGVFATRKIRKGEELLFVPWEAIIQDEDCYGLDCGDDQWCDTVNAMMQLADSEDMKPYFEYLYLAIEKNKPPELWSKEGKILIESVTGLNLPPDEVKYFSEGNSLHYWYDPCDGDEGESIAQNFTVLFDDVGRFFNLVPYLDLYNHRGGDWNNAEITSGEYGVSLVTKRKINKGEQIYLNFNDMNDDYDTALLFLNHGLIPEFPQRWVIAKKFDFTVAEEKEILGQTYAYWNTEARPTYNDISFLMEEAERLRSLIVVKDLGIDSHPNVSKNEWEMTWQYHGAILNGIESVLKLIEKEKEIDESLEGVDATLKNENENDWVDDHTTCRLDDAYMVVNENDEIRIQTKYQKLIFFEKPEVGDLCLDLDGTLQICNHYRPFYHEPFVHFPATLLKNMKRVVFVGGGDSMLLSEVLQYPEIEFVLGLELDQQVVRQSFKYFHTQPHFDDNRVQWWFGDVTKTLKVLPKSYFGSFDLVMIDLSETVMSFPVTDKLDMVGTLALLTKPDGIFMKNEKYFEKFQSMFDYSMELNLRNNPTLCDQYFSIGTNKLDLLRPDFKKILHSNIQTLFYKPLDDENHHNQLIYRYTKNDSTDTTSCDQFLELEDDFASDSNGGILMIIEAENASMIHLSKREKLGDRLSEELQNIGFSPVSTFGYMATNGIWTVILILEAGYIVGRVWSQYSYCGFDVNFWGAYDKMELVGKTLLGAIESKNPSTYRLVVGGMSGTVTHDTDAKIIGPEIVNHRNCNSNSQNEETGEFMTSMNQLVVDKSSKSLSKVNSIIALFCGDISSVLCKNFDTIDFKVGTQQYLTITSCPTDGNSDKMLKDSSAYNIESLCGDDFETNLYRIADKYQKFETIIFDETFPVADFKKVTEIFSRKKNQPSLVESKFSFIIPNIDDVKKNLVEKMRHKVTQLGPATLIEIDTMNNSKVLIFAAGRRGIIPDIVNVLDRVKMESGIELDIIHILGDPIKWQNDFNPQYFKQTDYDSLPGLQQYSKQTPLGAQSILQYEMVDISSVENLTRDSILQCFKKVVEKSFQILKLDSLSNVGDGIIIFALLNEGQVFLVWDGSDHIDMNVFTYSESIDHESMFGAPFQTEFDNIITLRSKDEQPRGINQVINFTRDLVGRSVNCWDRYLKCQDYEKLGYCNRDMKEEWMDENWMLENCQKSCRECA